MSQFTAVFLLKDRGVFSAGPAGFIGRHRTLSDPSDESDPSDPSGKAESFSMPDGDDSSESSDLSDLSDGSDGSDSPDNAGEGRCHPAHPQKIWRRIWRFPRICLSLHSKSCHGALDEWLSQRSAKPSTAVRIRQAPRINRRSGIRFQNECPSVFISRR